MFPKIKQIHFIIRYYDLYGTDIRIFSKGQHYLWDGLAASLSSKRQTAVFRCDALSSCYDKEQRRRRRRRRRWRWSLSLKRDILSVGQLDPIFQTLFPHFAAIKTLFQDVMVTFFFFLRCHHCFCFLTTFDNKAFFCDKSYKASMIVIYDFRVVADLKIPHITTLD